MSEPMRTEGGCPIRKGAARVRLVLSMMDNLKLAQAAHLALQREQFEVCSLIRQEIKDRMATGRLNDVYFFAAEAMGYADDLSATDNLLFETPDEWILG